jgi:hypothetical protein
MTETVVFPGSGSDDGFVQCARPGLKPTGKLYRKQLLHYGPFQHPKIPGQQIVVDEVFADTLIRNFANGVCDTVQVPLVDGQNKHTEDPTRNIGAVVDIEKTDKGVYAIIDARKEEYANELGKTLLGASAMMHLDYVDTRTGEHVGPTLLHAAITNRPYITNLENFEEIVMASADTNNDIVLLGAINENEEQSMTKDELIAALKEEHGIDVEALQATTEAATAQLSNVLGDTVSVDDVASALLELSAKNDEQTTKLTEQASKLTEQSSKLEEQDAKLAKLAEQNEALRLSSAQAEIDTLIQEGRILPKQRERMLALSMNDRETFDDLLPDTSIVSLSESGVTNHVDSRSDETQKELDRYVDMVTKK